MAVPLAGLLTLGIAFLLDVLWPLDRENCALHDRVCYSRVVVRRTTSFNAATTAL